MNTSDFISPNDILADVLVEVQDEELKMGFSKGWYNAQIQRAVEELAYDTFFDKKTLDVDFPRESLMMKMPKNAFNIKEMYLFNGECKPGDSVKVYWKRQFNNKNGGKYTASRTDDNGSSALDPFYSSKSSGGGTYNTNLFYYNIQNGMIMFSSNGKSYSKVRIIYNGTGGAIDETPYILRYLRQAVIDYVTLQQFKAMKTRDRNMYRTMYTDKYSELYSIPNGTWYKAERRVKTLDTLERETLKQYVGRMNIV